MLPIVPLGPLDVPDLVDFLRRADLTLSGLDAPTVRLWLVRDARDRVLGSTGYEVSDDGRHALVRSVAVEASERRSGLGGRLARFALEQAAAGGAERAWLFSRRSGPFWARLGFVRSECDELGRVLASTEQVRLFRRTGQLQQEVAWSRSLADLVDS